MNEKKKYTKETLISVCDLRKKLKKLALIPYPKQREKTKRKPERKA